MAFALTGYAARGIDIAGPSYKRGIQQVVFKITALATDVDLDIGDSAGTFWTAAAADSTYGSLAAKALLSLTRIAAQSSNLLAIKSPQLLKRVQSAAVGNNGEFAVSIDVLGPDILFKASDGETALYVVLDYELNDSARPEIMSLGSL